MGVFNPSTNTDITPVRPQEGIRTPSPLSGIASLVSTLSSGNSNQPSAAALKDAKESAQLRAWTTGLMEVEKLSKIDPEAGKVRMRELTTNATMDGLNVGGDAAKQIYRDVTGRDPDFMSVDPEQARIEAFMKTPEFGGLVAASYSALDPDATNEDRRNWALAEWSKQEDHKRILAGEGYEYTKNSKGSVEALLRVKSAEIHGLLNIALRDGAAITREEFMTYKNEWEKFRTQIYGMPGANGDGFETTKRMIDSIDAQFTTAEAMSGGKGWEAILSEDRNKIRATVVQAVGDLVERGEMTAAEAEAAVNLIDENPGTFLTLSNDEGPLGAVQQVINALKAIKVVEDDNKAQKADKESSIVDGPGKTKTPPPPTVEKVIEDSMSANPVKGLEMVKNLNKLSVGALQAGKHDIAIASIKATVRAFTKVDNLNQWVKADSVNQIFNGSFISFVEKLKTERPEEAKELTEILRESLRTVIASNEVRLGVVVEELGLFKYDEKTKKMALDVDRVDAELGKEGKGQQFVAVVDYLYNGDFAAFIEQNKGDFSAWERRLQRAAEMGEPNFPFPITDEATGEFDIRLSKGDVERIMGLYKNNDAKMKQATQLGDANKALASKLAEVNVLAKKADIYKGTMGNVVHKALPPKLANDKQFTDRVQKFSEITKIPADWLYAVIDFESKFSTTAENPHTKATGLIQFMPDTAKGLGTSIEALSGMTAVQQMDFVEKYYAPYVHKIKRPEDMYLATIWPLALGKNDDFVIGRNAKEIASVAAQNPIFDTDKDGVITAGDIRDYFARSDAFGRYIDHNGSVSNNPSQHRRGSSGSTADGMGIGARMASSLDDIGPVFQPNGGTSGGDVVQQPGTSAIPTDGTPLTPDAVEDAAKEADEKKAEAEASKAVEEEKRQAEEDLLRNGLPEKGEGSSLRRDITSKMSAKDKSIMRKHGLRWSDLIVFSSQGEADKAVEQGFLQPGSVYYTEEGGIQRVEEDN